MTSSHNVAQFFRKHQVQNPVRRLRHQETFQVLLRRPIPSCPFLLPTPTSQRQTLASKKAGSRRAPSPERKNKKILRWPSSWFHCLSQKGHTVVQQIIAEDGWRRIPQHTPLHNARGTGHQRHNLVPLLLWTGTPHTSFFSCTVRMHNDVHSHHGSRTCLCASHHIHGHPW